MFNLKKGLAAFALLFFTTNTFAAVVTVEEASVKNGGSILFYTKNAPIVSEDEVRNEINRIKGILESKNKNGKISVIHQIADQPNPDTEIYVSLGNCYVDNDQRAIVSYTKCSDSVKYKHYSIVVDPSGWAAYNQTSLHYRVLISSESKVSVQTGSKDATHDFIAAIVRDEKLFDTVKTRPYPNTFCSALKSLGYNPTFSDEEKAIIKQCLKLN